MIRLVTCIFSLQSLIVSSKQQILMLVTILKKKSTKSLTTLWTDRSGESRRRPDRGTSSSIRIRIRRRLSKRRHRRPRR